jgi:hypothetical protein
MIHASDHKFVYLKPEVALPSNLANGGKIRVLIKANQ